MAEKWYLEIMRENNLPHLFFCHTCFCHLIEVNIVKLRKISFPTNDLNMKRSINVKLPDSLYRAAMELAKKDHISMSQFISTALAEKISVLMTEDYLRERAKNAPT